MKIRTVRPADAPDLETLFARLDTDWFRPHDLGPDGARAVADHVGEDVYLIGFLGSTPVAYGMLRGWDEGYETPSLGIAIREGYRDRGLGRQVMSALHDVVRVRGGHRVRLRVAAGHARARHLYASMGYRQVGVERGELVLVLDFCLEGSRSDLATLAQRPRGVCPESVQTARPHHRTARPSSVRLPPSAPRPQP